VIVTVRGPIIRDAESLQRSATSHLWVANDHGVGVLEYDDNEWPKDDRDDDNDDVDGGERHMPM
jgi:hypothetical protein